MSRGVIAAACAMPLGGLLDLQSNPELNAFKKTPLIYTKISKPQMASGAEWPWCPANALGVNETQAQAGSRCHRRLPLKQSFPT